MVLATPIALGSWWGLIPAALLMAGIVVRLLDEERFLVRQPPRLRRLPAPHALPAGAGNLVAPPRSAGACIRVAADLSIRLASTPSPFPLEYFDHDARATASSTASASTASTAEQMVKDALKGADDGELYLEYVTPRAWSSTMAG